MITRKNFPLSRRTFLHASAVAGTTLAASTMTRTASARKADAPDPGTIVLFQGDSITDAGRSRRSTGPNDAAALGHGYPVLIGSALLADYPAAGLTVLNRGISGHKVPDLAKRWDKDTIGLKPDILSILIGVNDIWHKLSGRYNGTVKDYETGFRDLLNRTRKGLPDVRIVVCEPFVLRCGAVNDTWFPEFDQRREMARKVAGELNLTFVPFQAMFNEAVKKAAPLYWTRDGVHPTLAGHGLMAKTWRDVVGI